MRQAKWAADAGFGRLWISDHFHPWNDQQGQSPLVWSVIGALSEAVPGMPVTPDPEAYARRVQSYVDARFDEVYVAQIGPRQEEFFQFWQDKVAPRL